MIALGRTLDEAMWRAVELETIARQYYHALLLPGGPTILPESAIRETLVAFVNYGVPGAKRVEKISAKRIEKPSVKRLEKRSAKRVESTVRKSSKTRAPK
jgi:ribulose-5-phosphate 4-epimerase/fuculose-1-phosphate aldolase